MHEDSGPLSPTPTLPRKRGREHTESAASIDSIHNKTLYARCTLRTNAGDRNMRVTILQHHRRPIAQSRDDLRYVEPSLTDSARTRARRFRATPRQSAGHAKGIPLHRRTDAA